jgi:parvulin-like peptidyl-prolyl isomerase
MSGKLVDFLNTIIFILFEIVFKKFWSEGKNQILEKNLDNSSSDEDWRVMARQQIKEDEDKMSEAVRKAQKEIEDFHREMREKRQRHKNTQTTKVIKCN